MSVLSAKNTFYREMKVQIRAEKNASAKLLSNTVK